MEKILDVPFNKLTLEEVLDVVKKSVESGKKLHIVTLNTEMIMLAQKHNHFKQIVQNAGLVVPESSGLQLAWQYQNNRKKGWLSLLESGLRTVTGKGLKDPLEIIPGVDLAVFIAGMASEFGYKLMLVGSRGGVANLAKEQLKKRFPTLKVDSYQGGNFDGSEEASYLTDHPSDIIFVALGVPKQEEWIAAHLAHLNTKVAIGVGGTLDFLSGKLPRAPVPLRRLGLEWLFRLVRQPARAKRQLSLLSFMLKLVRG